MGGSWLDQLPYTEKFSRSWHTKKLTVLGILVQSAWFSGLLVAGFHHTTHVQGTGVLCRDAQAGGILRHVRVMVLCSGQTSQPARGEVAAPLLSLPVVKAVSERCMQ